MIVRFLQIAVPFVWFGLVLGLSFIETPLKFQAPGITIPLGLGIGHLVFFALNKIEIFLAVVLLISLILARPVKTIAAASFGVATVLLILQTAWLLPVLDARAAQVVGGTDPGASNLHLIYIAFDLVKLILLLTLGTAAIRTHLKAD
jgi:hypothetical protein